MHLAATLDASVDGAVEFEFEVTNTGEEPVDLTFSSGKTADVIVSADDSEVWRWSEGQLFIQALQSHTLDAGESMAQQFIWEDPPAGEYTARATLAAQDVDVDATTTLTV